MLSESSPIININNGLSTPTSNYQSLEAESEVEDNNQYDYAIFLKHHEDGKS